MPPHPGIGRSGGVRTIDLQSSKHGTQPMTGPIFLRTIARALAILAALSAVLGAAPVMAQPNGPAGWCAEGQSEHLGFRLDNGKTVSICEDEDGLTYSFGHVGAALELRY